MQIVTMMRRIQEALKPNGRVVLVEFRKEDPSVPIQPLHKMSVQEVRSELESVGFKFPTVARIPAVAAHYHFFSRQMTMDS